MKLKETIRIIETMQDIEGAPFTPLGKEALALGIEALKWRKSQKEAGYLDADDLLPGETKE